MNSDDFNMLLRTANILFFVLNPLGILPVFVSLLKDHDSRGYRNIVLRETGVALAVLVFFLVFGDRILQAMRISMSSLGIAGGIILFMISVKMVFGSPQVPENRDREPFIVPLAVPLFAGPGAITTTILMRGDSMHSLLAGLAALLPAWGVAALILLSGRKLASALGNKGIDAVESLMGFLLAAISTGMLVDGIKASFDL